MKVLKFTYQYLVLEKRRSSTEVGLQFEKTEAPLKWDYKDNFIEFLHFLFFSIVFSVTNQKGIVFLELYASMVVKLLDLVILDDVEPNAQNQLLQVWER